MQEEEKTGEQERDRERTENRITKLKKTVDKRGNRQIKKSTKKNRVKRTMEKN
jgi:hypothetical protein